MAMDKEATAKKILRQVIGALPKITQLKQLDITYTQQAILQQLILAKQNGSQLCMSDISQLIDVTKSAASQAVSKLERMGMLKRSWAKGDRRRIEVRLTLKGTETVELMYQDIINFILNKLGKMQEEELSLFIRILDKCMS